MGIWRGSGGHTFKNVGNMSHSCTDRDQIWHTYADPSGNGHELNINPLNRRARWLGFHQFINLGKPPNHWNDRDQSWHTYTDSAAS